jgi:hypothetical protein
VVFSGGESSHNAMFKPGATTGSSTVEVGVPAGFMMPSNSRQIAAMVTP